MPGGTEAPAGPPAARPAPDMPPRVSAVRSTLLLCTDCAALLATDGATRASATRTLSVAAAGGGGTKSARRNATVVTGGATIARAIGGVPTGMYGPEAGPLDGMAVRGGRRPCRVDAAPAGGADTDDEAAAPVTAPLAGAARGTSAPGTPATGDAGKPARDGLDASMGAPLPRDGSVGPVVRTSEGAAAGPLVTSASPATMPTAGCIGASGSAARSGPAVRGAGGTGTADGPNARMPDPTDAAGRIVPSLGPTCGAGPVCAAVAAPGAPCAARGAPPAVSGSLGPAFAVPAFPAPGVAAAALPSAPAGAGAPSAALNRFAISAADALFRRAIRSPTVTRPQRPAGPPPPQAMPWPDPSARARTRPGRRAPPRPRPPA